MPSIKDLKKRITSTKNTQQTTKAMKMVSAAKLRRAQEAILAQRPYAKGIQKLIKELVTQVEGEFSHPALKKTDSTEKKRLLLVLVTSDRGLCGGFNGNIIRFTQRWLIANSSNYASVKLALIGRRGNDFFKGMTKIDSHYLGEVAGKITFARTKGFSEWILGEFTSGNVDEVKVVYNEFKNAISQNITVEDYLPITGFQTAESTETESKNIIVKPNAEEILTTLLDRTVAIQLFRVLLESQASEHGARMSAMENATRNAGEMIRKLTLSYNKQRQAAITKELLEIISGSESQKQA